MKIGDKVRIVHSPYMADELQPGKTGRIVRIIGDIYDVVTCDCHTNEGGDLNWPFEYYELEVINV